ncbi:MAG: phenylalanine--tRNA ligase subunit beta [Candidatus Moranbacteria bacterium]|nr:phenylalanine--tRNA ligase subunit beta [Candidatus Moranbacteria bacterium]MBP7695978.1 phenylalanine--tRNA ligase subunit beta [Candidatus Moranbacteria bacterium]
MKYSYHWLKELSGTKKPAERVADLLMRHAFEVEGVESYPHGLDGVLTGRVLSVVPHPNADRLRVAQVELGKNDVRQIVCGAPNLAEGQKVVVVLPGASLPGGIEIRAAEIRGVQSNGMICSEKELGIGDGHTGILVLPDEAPIGSEFAKLVGLSDTILDVKILADRGSDALSYEGLAREIAALDGHAPQFAETKAKPFKIPSYNRAPKVQIADKKACRRYVGLLFKDVEVGESPLWLKTKLLVSGLRPINNIVDITNYLMLRTGQPLHAFDADTLSGGVHIRMAKKGEKLELLTGEKKSLSTDDLVIADAKHPLALAGIMGGKHSGVTAETKDIFLEIANFDGATLRRTRIRHGLATDASYRFERNLDPNLPIEVAREAAELIRELAGGKLAGARDEYPEKRKEWKIELALSRVEGVLGVKVPIFEVVQYLALQGLTVRKQNGKDALLVTIPTRRPDLRDEWDLIEEIGRMRGYDKVSPVAPLLPLVAVPGNPVKHFERNTKERLAHAGFTEIMTYSFYGVRDIEAFGLEEAGHVELANPLNPDQTHLRRSLVPSLLRKVKENLRHTDTFRIFEWESVFEKWKKLEVREAKMLVIASVSRDGGVREFARLKGSIENLLESLHIGGAEFVPHAAPESGDEWHRVQSADILVGGRKLGTIGTLMPFIMKNFGIASGMAVAVLDTEALRSSVETETVFRPLPRFPFAVRDISLVFEKKVESGSVVRRMLDAGAPLLRSAELFDIFEKEGSRSLAFHLSFGADERTLTSDEMDAAFERIVSEVEHELGGRLNR